MQQANHLAEGGSDRKRNTERITSLVPRELSEGETEREHQSCEMCVLIFPSLGLERGLGAQ